MSETLDYIQLSELAEISMGQSPDSSFCNSDEKGLPFLQGCAEFGRINPSSNIYCFPPLRRSKPDSLLISVRAPVGKLNWSDQEYCIGRGLGSIKAKQTTANTQFLKYAIEVGINFLYRRSQGSTFLAIGSIDLHEFPIPNFSFPQQRKIARTLQTIDRAIESTQALIEKYQLIKAGLMHDLFTRGIGADGKLRPPREAAPELYQKTAIGWIPKEWTVEACKTMFLFDSGITLGVHRRPKNNPRPYLRVANVFKEKIKLHDIAYLEASDIEQEKYQLKTFDLLLVEGHANIQEIGRCGMVMDNAEGMLYQNHLFRLKALSVTPNFGLYLLNSHIARSYWERTCSTSSGLNTINQKMLGNMPLCQPSITEQSLIENRISSINHLIDKENTLFEKLRKQKAGLMHDLLTGKVQVKVDDDESDN